MIYVDGIKLISKNQPLISHVMLRNSSSLGSTGKCLSATTFNSFINELPEVQKREFLNCVHKGFEIASTKAILGNIDTFDILTPRKLSGLISYETRSVRATERVSISSNIYGGRSIALVDRPEVYEYLTYNSFITYTGILIPKLNLLVTENEGTGRLFIKHIADIETASYIMMFDETSKTPVLLAMYKDSLYLVPGVISDTYNSSYIIPIRFVDKNTVEVVLWNKVGDKLNTLGPAIGKAKINDLFMVFKDEFAFPILRTDYTKTVDIARSYETSLLVGEYFNQIAYYNQLASIVESCGMHTLNGYLNFNHIVTDRKLYDRLQEKANPKKKTTSKRTSKTTKRARKSKSKVK